LLLPLPSLLLLLLQINPTRVGRRSRYLYANSYTPRGEAYAFIKFDLKPSWEPGGLPTMEEVRGRRSGRGGDDYGDGVGVTD